MEGEGNFQSGQPARPSRTRLFVALILLAFIGGLGVMGWLMTRWQNSHMPSEAVSRPADAGNDAENGSAESPAPTAQGTPANSVVPGVPPATSAADLDQHMLDLEQRLMRVSVAAQAASGYANRAEAMMVAFAARRALDAGTPLGYIDGQLRLLFGEAQPKAVATIINAANEPVTVNKLRAGLADIGQTIDESNASKGWWSAAMHMLGTLVEIRRADAPPPAPERRLERARRDVEAGQIEDAMSEVAALPQQPAIAQWLEQARRYNEAHRALDVIEAAAILEPRAMPIVAPAGQVAEAAKKSVTRKKRR